MAEGSGSGIYAEYSSNFKFLGTVVFQNNTCFTGCGIAALDSSKISFKGSATFAGNKAEGSGSGIYALFTSTLEFLGTAVFQRNTCSFGCGIAASITNISFDGSATIEGNMADVSGSGIYAEHSNTDFFGRVVFQNSICDCASMDDN